MKCEFEVRVCDSCGKRHEHNKRSMSTGCNPFQGWVDVIIFGPHVPGFSSGSNDLTGDRTFCSATCAKSYMERMISVEEERSSYRKTIIERDVHRKSDE